jgi:hypothetical protein
MTRGIRTLYYYDGTTVDPRGIDLKEPPEQYESR